jgi:hypothetical protein
MKLEEKIQGIFYSGRVAVILRDNAHGFVTRSEHNKKSFNFFRFISFLQIPILGIYFRLVLKIFFSVINLYISEIYLV